MEPRITVAVSIAAIFRLRPAEEQASILLFRIASLRRIRCMPAAYTMQAYGVIDACLRRLAGLSNQL
jgi:hypothetical protein